MQDSCQKTTHRQIFKSQKIKVKGEKKLQVKEKASRGSGVGNTLPIEEQR